MKTLLNGVLGGVLGISYALAGEMPGPAPTTTPELTATQQWLELQRSGTAASKQSQPISGEVMDKVHQRYLKSFDKPIPEFYEHQPVTH